MKEESENKIARASAIGGYLSLYALGIWRWFRGPSSAEPGTAKKEADLPDTVKLYTELAGGLALPAPQSQDTLESLSLTTPGNAPLDRLARRAAFEEEKVARIQPGGGLADLHVPDPPGPKQPWTHDSAAVASMLQHQALDSEPLTGWSNPVGDRLPVPTFTPTIMAFGIVVFAMGLATTWYVCVAGSLIFALAAWRWAGELQGE